jgi:hypothetical protein
MYRYDYYSGRAASDAPLSFERFTGFVEGLPKRSLLLPTLVHMQVWQDSRSITASRTFEFTPNQSAYARSMYLPPTLVIRTSRLTINVSQTSSSDQPPITPFDQHKSR